MTRLTIILIALMLAACEGSGTGQPVATVDPVPVVAPTPALVAPISPADAPDLVSAPSPTPVPTPVAVADPAAGQTAISVTVYSVTITDDPDKLWIYKTYTATGSCTTIRSSVFCWDDGVKTLHWTYNHFEYGPFYYTYWRAATNGFNCYGGCDGDGMTSPTLITEAYIGNIPTTKINNVFSHGTAITLSCVDDGGVITCPGFVIDSRGI